jgi:hypothetical protein
MLRVPSIQERRRVVLPKLQSNNGTDAMKDDPQTAPDPKPTLPKEVEDAAWNLSVSLANHEEVFADLCNFAIQVINAKAN